ncbi:hypothetical protein GA0061098_103843 [Bradyrhizobium shewense]|uniref:Uncharacterized protein n=1 Tax=Bradyrhizobium shewense TaxID=1761772 RepID=A0A1C3XSS4_9BRAD|nr:hypothetical protein GA0061098_103843 [Bradyrhizobium shewense]
MDMGVGVVVPVRMVMSRRMVMGMTVSMVVMMGVGRGGNHAETLYYNITPVHDPGVIPGRLEEPNPESRDSQVRNCAP